MVLNVPDREAGCCLGSERNRVSMGGGGEGGPGPPEREEMSSRCPAKEGTTWRRTMKNKPIGCDGEGSARTE